MILAALEPGREIALANFFLAIFCLFTVALPLLLITRGDKTAANQDFLATALNPWSNVANEVEFAPVILSDITNSSKPDSNLENIPGQESEPISDLEEVIHLEERLSEGVDELANELQKTGDDILVA